MTRKRRAADQALLEALRERLVLTLNFFEKAQDFPNASRYRAQIERAAADGNLRAMRLMGREVEKMSIVLTSDQRDGLDAILRDRLGVDRDTERVNLQREVAATIARGAIASEKERHRLEDYVEILEAEGGGHDEIDAINRLLRNA